MRMLLVTHNVISGDGQGRVNLQLALHCLNAGHRVTLIADRVDPDVIARGAAWLPVHPLVDRPNLIKAWQFARGANRIVRSRQCNRRGPDRGGERELVIANGYVMTEPHDVNISHYVHGAAAGRGRAAAAARLSTVGPRSAYHALYRRFNAHAERASYAAARAVVAISERVRGELLEVGVPPARVTVIHNGVDTDEFRPGPVDRAALGLPVDVPLALFVGDIRSGRKNLDTALAALALAPTVHLAVVGDTRESPCLQLARRLGVDGRVRFLGYRRDVPQVMRGCDFLVFPTRYEPFGLVILEALSSGLPVITTRQAGAAEVMEPGCGTLLDDPDDATALARAMIALADPNRRAESALLARDVACRHAWARMAGRYVALFEALAANHGAATSAT